MTRPKFKTRIIRLVGETQRETAIAMLNNLPLDAEHPLEIVAREEVKVRKQSANDAMWAGALKDIAEQAWLNKRQYSAEVWHEHFKREYLPEDDDPDIAARDKFRPGQEDNQRQGENDGSEHRHAENDQPCIAHPPHPLTTGYPRRA